MEHKKCDVRKIALVPHHRAMGPGRKKVSPAQDALSLGNKLPFFFLCGELHQKMEGDEACVPLKFFSLVLG